MVFMAGCSDERVPYKHYLPHGYSGLITIEYGNSKCDPLRKESGYYIIKFSSSGNFCTSDMPPSGVARDFYCYGNSHDFTEIPIDKISKEHSWTEESFVNGNKMPAKKYWQALVSK